jgi:TRAP-type C4-dicarboxylate transport system substrate-binding protein
MKLTRRAALAGTSLLAAPNIVAAQTMVNLTIAASHPTTISWIWALQNALMPTVNKELENTRFRIRWREAFGGTLYKFNETRTAVRDGLTDVGWVGTLWEGSAMPLQNITYFTPFATDDLRKQTTLMDEMTNTMPEMNKAWEENSMVYLGGSGTESYQLWTTFPVRSMEDLRNRRINAPGVSAAWLRGTGAVPVDGALTTYFTDIQTGVSEGCLSFASGLYPVRVHELAKNITMVNVGCMYVGGVAVNSGVWRRLAPEVQAALKAGGRAYTAALNDRVLTSAETNLKLMQQAGCTVSTLPAAERQKWISGLPDIAGDWAKATEARGQPARKILAAYMGGLRRVGETPSRAWDQVG